MCRPPSTQTCRLNDPNEIFQITLGYSRKYPHRPMDDTEDFQEGQWQFMQDSNPADSKSGEFQNFTSF